MDYTNLIIDKLKGELSQEDSHALDEWIAASEENYTLYIQTKEIWELTGEGSLDFAKEKIHAKKLLERKTKGYSRYKTRKRWLQAVSAAILALICSFSIKTYLLPKESNPPSVNAYYSTEENKEILLLDGSKVLLEPNTTLILRKGFNTDKRVVSLAGAAFFDIKKNASLPFIIQDELFEVVVLGTAFHISEKDRYGRIKVSVVRGLVKVHFERDSSFVHPGESVIVSTEDHQLFPGTFRPGFPQFSTTPLIFKQTPLVKVAEILAKRFNIEISVKGNPSKCFFTGQFDNESIDEIIKVLHKAIALTSIKSSPKKYTWIVKQC